MDIFRYARPQKGYFPYALSPKVTGRPAPPKPASKEEDIEGKEALTQERGQGKLWIRMQDNPRMIAVHQNKRVTSPD